MNILATFSETDYLRTMMYSKRYVFAA
jgi:hypothetical protein